MTSTQPPKHRTALALARSGPLGAIDEIGANYHGSPLNQAVLNDAHRHVYVPRRPRARIGRALTKLQNPMDNLQQVVSPAEQKGLAQW